MEPGCNRGNQQQPGEEVDERQKQYRHHKIDEQHQHRGEYEPAAMQSDKLVAGRLGSCSRRKRIEQTIGCINKPHRKSKNSGDGGVDWGNRF